MMLIIFFIYIPLVYSELHSLISTYTGISGQTAAGTPEFSAVTTLDGEQIDYYDSNIEELILRQDWMEKFTYKDMWKEDTEIRKHVQQIYRNNIPVLMQRFNHTHGVHKYQRIYGCEYDDETRFLQGFDRYTYDGEDFIILSVRERRYIAHVPQAIPTVDKWNKDEERFILLKRYYDHECVYWLEYFLALREPGYKRKESPSSNSLALMICVMGALTVLVIAIFFIGKKRSRFKRVCSREEFSTTYPSYFDKSL
ncbi:class I histocompatibility antigen, F10 alpha chain-like [Pimephales promelas]|uniref:class I histocompatibility antigen, F10 alpha chain-like n=1 Tax=Pimephales promelas TaxID=90988 RepID=UPI00195595FA|nr:class I histocompatibility antigen, F10 alpha chain-like [Pimephales promelas]